MRHISPWLVRTLALGQYHLQARGYLIAVVDTIEDIRWANLLLLIQEQGSIQGVAELIDKSHSQVSQYKLRSPHSRTGKPRNIGSPMARLLEDKAGKGRGWMDQPHAAAKALAQAEIVKNTAKALASNRIAEERMAAAAALRSGSTFKGPSGTYRFEAESGGVSASRKSSKKGDA